MKHLGASHLRRILTLLVGVLIFKVTINVVLIYRDYFPPNFESDFLRGREGYFSGAYHWAFYTHIVSSPVSLLLGTILVSERFRRKFPRWHRLLGRIQCLGVLLLVTPSGLWMACYADSGGIASIGFATLAVGTGVCVALGWRSAVKRRFAAHRRWMWRCYLMLCSAVVLRLIAGLAAVIGLDAEWVYPLSAWISWLIPLAVFELSALGSRLSKNALGPSILLLHER